MKKNSPGCNCCQPCQPCGTQQFVDDFSGSWPGDWTEITGCDGLPLNVFGMDSGVLRNEDGALNSGAAFIEVPGVTWEDINCISVSADIEWIEHLISIQGITIHQGCFFGARRNIPSTNYVTRVLRVIDQDGCGSSIVTGGQTITPNSGTLLQRFSRDEAANTNNQFCWDGALHVEFNNVLTWPAGAIRCGVLFTRGAAGTTPGWVKWDNFRVAVDLI